MYEWFTFVEVPGFYYWRCKAMDKNHVMIIQVTRYRYPNTDGHNVFHAQVLLPTSGSAYDYKFNGPIEDIPKGEFWGPLPQITEK